MTDTTFVSRYEQRIAFVQDVLNKNSDLGDKSAHDLAVQVLAAIDNIPESIGR
jgi:uncharacterized protein DUF6307